MLFECVCHYLNMFVCLIFVCFFPVLFCLFVWGLHVMSFIHVAISKLLPIIFYHDFVVSQCLLEENEAQRQEIQRLKRQTAKLTLFAKSAAADRNNVYVSSHSMCVT